MKKIVTIIGARPQFIKAAVVSREIKRSFSNVFNEIIVHTGQHFDKNMSETFFDQLDIPKPGYNLGVSGGSHASMTARMLEAIEEVLYIEKPDMVLTYGDTNSTLAAALAAVKLHIPVAHVESGLRSFNRRMPEEINRILTDTVSSLLFCPTTASVANLSDEGVHEGVCLVGDVMFDAALYYRDKAASDSTILDRLGVNDRPFVLATCHRAENTDDAGRLIEIIKAISSISFRLPVVLPIHPRTKKIISEMSGIDFAASVICVEPLPYLDMVCLEQAAEVILTDSGGVQKEAFFFHTPCVTIRDETEWMETLALGVNSLVEANEKKILKAVMAYSEVKFGLDQPYGDGAAANKLLSIMRDYQ